MQKFTPEQTKVRQEAMLSAYKETGSVVRASVLCGVPHKWHQRWMRDDIGYVSAFEQVKSDRLADGLRCGEGHGRPKKDWADAQRRFLETFARVGLVKTAAKEVGIDSSRHYLWLADDADYARRFHDIEGQVGNLAAQNRRPHGGGYRLGGPRAERIRQMKAAFLRALAESGIVAMAAEQIGTSSSNIFGMMRYDSEFAERVNTIREATRELAASLTHEKRSASMKAVWESMTPEQLEAWSKAVSATWTEERRVERGEQAKERFHGSPEVRERHKAAVREAWQRPEMRAKRSELSRRNWADPEYREKQLTAMRTPESRERRAKTASALWAAMTPEERTKHIQRLNSTFTGGHKLTGIEAAVLVVLNGLEVPYLAHKQIGTYTADVYVPHLKLDIECDGGYFHNESTAAREAERDAVLVAEGITVLRMTEAEIKAKDFSRLHAALGGS